MFRNYLKTAWRNILKKRFYSLINILGLSIGITACLLIGLFVSNELSYDKFNTNASRIGRLTMEYSSSGTVNKVSMTGNKAGPQLKRTFPEIEAYTRLEKYPRSLAYGTKAFDEKNLLYADEGFFNVFSFKLLRGNPATALSGRNKVVLTSETAKKYFGSEDPMGKTLRINGFLDVEVTGIVEPPPLASQIQYDLLVSLPTLPGFTDEEIWWTANYTTYLLVKDPKQLEPLQAKITAYMKDVSKGELQLTGTDYMTLHLEPLLRVHLHSELEGLEPKGNIAYVYILAAVAILILLIACVNYTNLATAQSAGRGTEISIRKVFGAAQKQLFSQFLGESFLVTFLSIFIALLAAILLMPLFNVISGKQFTIGMLFQPMPLVTLVALGMVVGFLAGAYPAFILSHAKLINLLKSGFRVSSSGGVIRKSLIVFQFVISIFLIGVTTVIINQMSFIRNKELGYKKDQVLILPVDARIHNYYDELKRAISITPGVMSISGAYENPSFVRWGDGIETEDGNGKKKLSLTAMPVDLNFTSTFGMQLVAGRDFTTSDFAVQDTSHDYANYRTTYLLNENAVKALGWTPDQAIGKIISKRFPGEVKGVVKDFHFASLHQPIGPVVMWLDTGMVRQMFVKINAAQIPKTLSGIEQVWKERVNHRPFSYHFLDEEFNKLYVTEEKTAKLFSLFSTTAIALACLGLFALAAFSTVQRTKEIGIRKVLGAGSFRIAALVSKEFLWLVVLAIVIASPFAWFAARSWLQDFAYRINLSWWMFALSGLLAILIAVFTISYHAMRAALANPITSLRSE